MSGTYVQHQFEGFNGVYPDNEPTPVYGEDEIMYDEISDTYINFLVTHPDYEEGQENNYYGDIFEAVIHWWEEEHGRRLSPEEIADMRKMIKGDCL